MVFAKIRVKNDYSEKGDLVFRPIVRAFKEIGAEGFMEAGDAIILGVVSNDGIFKELITGKEIAYGGYEEMGFGDMYNFLSKIFSSGLSKEQIEKIRNVINYYIFKEGVYSSNEDEYVRMINAANDRAAAFNASVRGKNPVDTYDKANPNNYADFLYICKMLDSIRALEEKNKSK